MLEKLAEMVREQADEVGLTTNQLCFMCEHSQEECLHNNKATCINANTPNGSFRIARWAVLLVAKGLEGRLAAYKEAKDECRKIHTDDDSDEEWCAEQWFHRRAFQVSEAIRDLIAEAREDASDER